MTIRRIVPAEATEEMLLQGMIAKTTRAEEIDGPIAPLPTDRDPTIDEVGDYCTRTALRLSSTAEIGSVYAAMLAASPASGNVTEEEVRTALNEFIRVWRTGGKHISLQTDAIRAALASLGLEVG